MNTNIESQLRDYLAKNILFMEGGGSLADDTSFLAEGVIDSIGVTELAEYVAQQFGFEVPLRDITPANFDSIAGLAGYVRRRLAEDGGRRTEDGRRRTEDGGQKTEDGGRKTEDAGRKTEDGEREGKAETMKAEMLKGESGDTGEGGLKTEDGEERAEMVNAEC